MAPETTLASRTSGRRPPAFNEAGARWPRKQSFIDLPHVELRALQ